MADPELQATEELLQVIEETESDEAERANAELLARFQRARPLRKLIMLITNPQIAEMDRIESAMKSVPEARLSANVNEGQIILRG